MTAWARHRGLWLGAAVLPLALVAGGPLGATPIPAPGASFPSRWEAAADPLPLPSPADPKPTPARLRARAAAAEQAGDWETAFAAYCELYVTDRTSPGLRDKLNNALRRVQQVRRHREAAFQQFVAGLSVPEAAALFEEVVFKLPPTFVDPARSSPQQLWANGVEELDRALALPGFRQAFLGNASAEKLEVFRLSLRTYWARRPVADTRSAKAALKQLIAAAQDAFPVRVPAALGVEFVCGACSGLDEYTVFLTPALAPDAADAVPDLSAYGLYLGFTDGGVVIDGVAAGSWAAFHTQLRKGDRVARVNGRALTGMGPTAVAEALRAPVDGAHEVELDPAGAEMLPVVVRLPLAVPTVFGASIISSKDGLGYVRVAGIQPSTPRELDDAILTLKARGMRALILDLRGNHGGSFVAGVEVARRLLPAGLIVTTQGQLPAVAGQVFSSDSGMNALDVPLVVLIDAETASAAEVVAAAVRDNDRAVLVGMPSFGKGTIQYPLKLGGADDGMGPRSGTVRVTIARLIGPRGAPINGVGVTPHVIEADPVRQWDLAVERAVELLQPMAPRSPVPMPPSQ